MKISNFRYALVALLLLIITIPAAAQTGTFFEAGLGASYGSNERRTGFPEIHGAIGLQVAEFRDSTVQIRARGKFSKTAEIADLFTRDKNPLRRPTGELKLGFEGRWNLSTESYFKPFVAFGGEYTRHFGLNGAPQSGLNPALTFGMRAGYGYEVFYTRLLEDRLNRDGFPVQQVSGYLTDRRESSKLKGDRIGANYLFKARGKLHLKFGAEVDYVSYRACSNKACDAYREYDWIARPFVAISIF